MASPSRSPSRSPKRKGSEKFHMYRKMSMVAFVALLTLVVSYLYVKKGQNWWTHIEPRTPTYGDNEALVLFVFVAWFASLVYIVYALTEAVRDEKEKTVVYMAYALCCFLTIAYFYDMADNRRSYENGFLVSLMLLIITLFLCFMAYKVYHNRALMLSFLALLAIGYIAMWSYDVTNSKAN